jgi:hypothetical protein
VAASAPAPIRSRQPYVQSAIPAVAGSGVASGSWTKAKVHAGHGSCRSGKSANSTTQAPPRVKLAPRNTPLLAERPAQDRKGVFNTASHTEHMEAAPLFSLQ